MSKFFNNMQLVNRTLKINGFSVISKEIQSNKKLDFLDVMITAADELEEEYSDWPEGQGFGSSDYTYALQRFIDSILDLVGMSGSYKTDFIPILSIIKK